ncbi:hypothetical protein GQ473_01835 [archaeon]|nr:hypothetical protein [archaeon]
MKLKHGLFIGAIGLLLIIFSVVFASSYLVDEDMNLLGNDIYNATNINATIFYQNGSALLDISGNYYTDIANFTGTLTDTKWCLYDSSNNIINCTVDPVTNTYNTTEEMQDAVGVMATDGNGVDFTYSDIGNTLTPSFDCSDVSGTGIGCSGEYIIHNDSSSQADSDNSGRTYIQDIFLDTYGHIQTLVTATETVTDSNANTLCSGTTTYLDGEGGCDDISSVYIAQSDEGNLNVNSSNYWDNLNTPNDFENITASGYITGQPITGSIGSGIINSSENLEHCGCMNITINQEREIHYPEFTARVVDTNGNVVYCYKAEGDINVTDNLHSTNYLNSSCEWNFESFETFHSADISPSGKVRIFDALVINGVIEETKGNTLLFLTKDKTEQIRIFCSSSSHLSVCNGFEITQDTFPSFNVSSGNSVYLNTYLPTDAKSSLIDETHLTHHENGSWVHTNTTGLNITHCDNGTDLVECTGTVYRQYPVYSLSWNSAAKIHMLSPLTTGATYTSLSSCVEATPDYILPAMETYVAIIHHIYCARRTDTVWNSDAWIDLRAEPIGAGGTPDLSPYLTIYADKPLLSNWDIGAYNFTNTDSWFLGKVDWSTIQNTPTLYNTTEELQDVTGAMFSGNTETLITATYQDGDGTIDLIVENDLNLYSWTNVVDGDIPNDITIASSNNITTTAGVNLNDNVKMRFGTENDACMYWDGSSLITTTVAANCG